GGPSFDGTRWIGCRPGFFLPVRVLSRLFRRLFLQNLQAAFDAGELRFFGNLAGLAAPTAFATGLDQLRRLEWVVYAKPPFGGPEQVLAYLGRTPIASPSPTAGWSRSPTARSASPGRTIARTARQR